MEVKRGVSRTVLLFGPWAIKIPSWRNGIVFFVGGMYCNLVEAERWRTAASYPEKAKHFARVLWCAPFGLCAVQERCLPLDRLLTRQEVQALPLIGYDNNAHNAGVRNGRIVVFDYATGFLDLVEPENVYDALAT